MAPTLQLSMPQHVSPKNFNPRDKGAASAAGVNGIGAAEAEAVDELDVEGILAFAERILPRPSDLCRRRSATSSGCSSCSSRKESRTTEIGPIELP
jgi:hypothetical protein